MLFCVNVNILPYNLSRFPVQFLFLFLFLNNCVHVNCHLSTAPERSAAALTQFDVLVLAWMVNDIRFCSVQVSYGATRTGIVLLAIARSAF